MASPIDLTTLADVKTYLGIKPNETLDDTVLQSLITGASQYWLDRTTRGSLNSIVSYNERYSGNGKDELMLRYYPILAVNSLTISGRVIAQSTDYQSTGWIIDDHRETIVLIGACFERGRSNVAITYQSGFAVVPADVAENVIKQVAVNYKRRKTIDQESLAIPEAGGTTTWRAWEIPPEVERVIKIYSPGTPI